ncbi:MAG: transcriptional repressor LexA [Phycisphaerales bacterium]|nr:MAG: transcriptional repressor LexA [Phycisphaerales bacterium]
MAKRRKRKTRKRRELPFMTPRQLAILTYVRDTRRSCGYSPTLQEIADELGISKITVFEHVDVLARKGMLKRRYYKARSLEVTPLAQLPDERPTLIPMLGRIAAGQPIEAIETPDTIDLEEVFAGRAPVGILTVAGDSMIDEQIRDGDWVVYEQRSNPRNGDTVVALIDDEATLKKFYREKNRIRLQPANERYKPIYVRDVEIQGVVTGVIRRL